MTGVLLIAVACLMFLTLYGLNMGSLGVFSLKILSNLLGKAAVLFPVFLLLLGLRLIIKGESLHYNKIYLSITLFVLCALALAHSYLVPYGEEILAESLPKGTGIIGGALLLILHRIVGSAGAVIILLAGLVCSLLLTGKFSIKDSVAKTENGMKNAAETFVQVKAQIKEKRFFYDQEKFEESDEQEVSEEPPVAFEQPIIEKFPLTPEFPAPIVAAFTEDDEQEISLKPQTVEGEVTKISEPEGTYVLPPLSLLNALPKSRQNQMREVTREQSMILEKTLSDFNVNARVIEITCGPSVTRFEVEPAPGVKVSRIVNLADDLALKLAAPAIRIEPIAGKSAIGIEVPNLKNETVPFRAVVDSDAVQKAENKLCVGLGKDISGNIIVADLGKMPHLLVAGSTGSGKSVCINTIIASILFRAKPEEVKLILVDPKVVELTNYNGIPHLLTPVVTNAKQAASALHWAVAEMERRYSAFADTQVRDISRFNEQAEEKLPYIIIIIDELADLMMVAAVDVEDAILRLAQKARAAGIHLILATQRPSVDVITGIIKANIPSRIAFAVSSQTDSRTILDIGGAEKLLGKGDMLFYPIGANRPQRVQGAFVSDEELDKVVGFIKNQAVPTEYKEEVTSQELGSDNKKQNVFGDEGYCEDELFEDAVRLVMDTKQASSSMLQRKFRIGYTRAARLVDTMEELGIVGPAMGSKPREQIMNNAEIESRFFEKS
ncbi:MAG TPA: DNA translocase FtsK 4TM domain-containing protein [Candidatus Avacidaminococcus intestinavium]|uniref:DNA translocase FtsK 4TM domain-containing protein n=1 Tax=Candidatus Avacidaminococcus intestinavium TaxID=2840684 RepID=A0A9D1MPW7_9FIRM|nr:DNA translocase FtsK 4TM domain-containing protein [Candidatus Avacidaminococcus intestinavium]